MLAAGEGRQFTSPGYDGVSNYAAEAKCLWTFAPAPGAELAFSCSAFSIISTAAVGEKGGSEDELFSEGGPGALVYSVCLGLVLFLISLVTLVGNVITIIAVKTVHSLRISKTNYLIVSLACADLMVSHSCHTTNTQYLQLNLQNKPTI